LVAQDIAWKDLLRIRELDADSTGTPVTIRTANCVGGSDQCGIRADCEGRRGADLSAFGFDVDECDGVAVRRLDRIEVQRSRDLLAFQRDCPFLQFAAQRRHAGGIAFRQGAVETGPRLLQLPARRLEGIRQTFPLATQ
jgi:hypothetical protein